MCQTVITKPKPPVKWPVKLILAFAFVALLGLTPWETILSIQIMNGTLKLLTGTNLGLFGLSGLLFTLLISCMLYKPPFALPAAILLSIAALVVSGVFTIGLVLPDFEWQDKAVYRNGNDYLVMQEQETFVTSSEQPPRVLRTTSPYGMVRRVQGWVLPKDVELFGGNEVFYEGKLWRKNSD
jgi:hypothetical protein